MKKIFETPSVKVVRFNRSVVMEESVIVEETNQSVVTGAVENAINNSGVGTAKLGTTVVTVSL